MTTDLDALYPEIIADHAAHPRLRQLRPDATVAARELNPTCGDEVTIQLVLDGERIVGAGWDGHGCMISQSSASILAEQLAGLTVDELRARIASFRLSMRSRGEIPVDEVLLGDAAALGGASRFVARVKCALLPWVAAESALRSRDPDPDFHGEPHPADGATRKG
ncbi:MAG: SUF system NifU family Fe-S cluster assembly protein [Microbacteriaceae bacterium]|nr:SUF system NifU family Fe-S cluster assembly protein [Microbacteriaceae bacterium]